MPELSPCSIIDLGRGEKIRTSGPCLPKAVLYQAELHPDLGPDKAAYFIEGNVAMEGVGRFSLSGTP